MAKKMLNKHDSARLDQVPELILPAQSATSCVGSVGYQIRVKDHLETYWFEWFEGWTVTNLENGEVLLQSAAVDQSGLHGALNKIRDLNLTLLSVTCFPTKEENKQ